MKELKRKTIDLIGEEVIMSLSEMKKVIGGDSNGQVETGINLIEKGFAEYVVE